MMTFTTVVGDLRWQVVYDDVYRGWQFAWKFQSGHVWHWGYFIPDSDYQHMFSILADLAPLNKWTVGE